jgi:hypothetical protein
VLQASCIQRPANSDEAHALAAMASVGGWSKGDVLCWLDALPDHSPSFMCGAHVYLLCTRTNLDSSAGMHDLFSMNQD